MVAVPRRYGSLLSVRVNKESPLASCIPLVFMGKRSVRVGGCLVRVCADCHNLSPHAIHNDPKTEKALQRDIQRKWQELNDKTDEDFIKTFGKGYLYE